MIKLGVRSERTKGVLAMTDEEFRAELQKPVAVIRIGMDEFRRQGQSARFSIGMGRVPAGDSTAKSPGTAAPSVTPEGIEALIIDETYTVLPNGRTTICQLTLRNGFTVEGQSACVCIENFDPVKGNKYSREDAVEKIWQLEGYLLKDRLFNMAAPQSAQS